MAVRTREELLAQINAVVGENNGDDVISLIEDVTDTMTDYETRVKGDGINWKDKYEENDKMWRDKYISRFNENADDNEPIGNPNDKPKKYDFNDLFEEKEM